jgi:hypothetical protein
MMGVEAIRNERFKAKNRGVQFRYITEITQDNISYCKQLSEFAQIRHLNGVKGNFEVSQKSTGKGEYIGAATLEEAEPVSQLIYSNVKEIVEQEQFVFITNIECISFVLSSGYMHQMWNTKKELHLQY